MQIGITIGDNVPGLPKVIIANIFAVSRSAVTQTCRKRDTKEDLVCRIYNYLEKRSKNAASRAHEIQSESVFLLQAIRAIIEKRSRVRKNIPGRTPIVFGFTELKRLIRAIVADMTAMCSRIVTEEVPVETQPVRFRELRNFANHIGQENYDKLMSGEITDDTPDIPGTRRLRRLF